MKFKKSVGEYLVVASEVSTKKTGRLSIVEEDTFVKGKVLCANGEIDVDDVVLFGRLKGTPVGNGFPANVVVVALEDVVAIVEEDE